MFSGVAEWSGCLLFTGSQEARCRNIRQQLQPRPPCADSKQPSVPSVTESSNAACAGNSISCSRHSSTMEIISSPAPLFNFFDVIDDANHALHEIA